MAVTPQTIDYACRTIAQLGKSNKEDEEIKLKIIKTGITRPLLVLASAPSTAAKPFDDWCVSAVLCPHVLAIM